MITVEDHRLSFQENDAGVGITLRLYLEHRNGVLLKVRWFLAVLSG
jgi:hypothetical protein